MPQRGAQIGAEIAQNAPAAQRRSRLFRARSPSPRVRGEGRDEGASPLGVELRRSEPRRGPLTLARYARSTSPRATGRGEKAISFSRGVFASEFCHVTVRKPSHEGRRSAERRIVFGAASSDAAAVSAETARLSALHRGLALANQRLCSAPAALPGFSAMGCHPILPVPVQRAPRRPVIDTGRAVSGAAWERGYEPRPQAPHPPRQLAVTGDVPSWAGSVHVTETVTHVNRDVTEFFAAKTNGAR